MSAVNGTVCPLLKAPCDTNCMMLLIASKTVVAPRDVGDASCAFAVLASHISSEEHSGGNYTMPVIGLYGKGES